jgi:hypothetical protein
VVLNYPPSDFILLFFYFVRGAARLSQLGELVRRFSEYVSRRSPGVLSFLNLYCTTSYGTDCVSLLFTSPSRLYHLVLKHFRGDVYSADYAFKLLLLNPLVTLLGAGEDIPSQLLELAKLGRDREFLELVSRYAGRVRGGSPGKDF